MYTERRERIRELLEQQPFVSLDALCGMFPQVSSMTLRRDIEFFEQQGEAIKVRGGARSMKFITASMEDAFSSRVRTNVGAKEKIAVAAAEMIGQSRSVFIDSGTTALHLAAALPDERLSVTTTGPNVALELSRNDHTIVNLVGGMLNRDSLSVSGTQALKYLEDVNIDTAFIVPSGVSAESGMTCGNYMECELKSTVIGKARQTIVLMDHSKLGKTLPYTFCRVKDVQVIISDFPLPPELEAEAKKNGTKLILA